MYVQINQPELTNLKDFISHISSLPPLYLVPVAEKNVVTYILVSIAVLALVCLIGLGIGRYRRNQQLKNSGRDSLGMLAYCGTMYVVTTLCSVHLSIILSVRQSIYQSV